MQFDRISERNDVVSELGAKSLHPEIDKRVCHAAYKVYDFLHSICLTYLIPSCLAIRSTDRTTTALANNTQDSCSRIHERLVVGMDVTFEFSLDALTL